MPVAIAGAWKKKIVPRNMYAANRTAPNAVSTTPSDAAVAAAPRSVIRVVTARSEEHTSELQSLMRISYAVFCLKKQNNQDNTKQTTHFVYYLTMPHQISM